MKFSPVKYDTVWYDQIITVVTSSPFKCAAVNPCVIL